MWPIEIKKLGPFALDTLDQMLCVGRWSIYYGKGPKKEIWSVWDGAYFQVFWRLYKWPTDEEWKKAGKGGILGPW